MRYHDTIVAFSNISLHVVFRPLNNRASYMLYMSYDSKPGAPAEQHDDSRFVPALPQNVVLRIPCLQSWKGGSWRGSQYGAFWREEWPLKAT